MFGERSYDPQSTRSTLRIAGDEREKPRALQTHSGPCGCDGAEELQQPFVVQAGLGWIEQVPARATLEGDGREGTCTYTDPGGIEKRGGRAEKDFVKVASGSAGSPLLQTPAEARGEIDRPPNENKNKNGVASLPSRQARC